MMKNILKDKLNDGELLEAYKAALEFLGKTAACPIDCGTRCELCPYKVSNGDCGQIYIREFVGKMLYRSDINTFIPTEEFKRGRK